MGVANGWSIIIIYLYNTSQIFDEHVPVIVGGVVTSTDNLDQAVMCYHI